MNTQGKILFLLYIFFSLSTYSQTIKNQSKVDIIDLSIEASLSIKCEDFNNYFKDEIKTFKLKKVEKKNLKIISTLSPLEKRPYLDTRYKGEIFCEKKKYLFCGDSKSIEINTKYYSTSPELIKLFENLLSKY